MSPEKIYDMVVIGGGPGGYTAAIYGTRAGLETLVLEKLSAGGQMALTSQIDNYPGFSEGVDGFILGDSMMQQAERFKAHTEYDQVLSVDLGGKIKLITGSEDSYKARTVIFATGAVPAELGLENEKNLIGRGVAYCASCDGMFYKGKTVVVVGGGNSAVSDALILSKLAKKVIVVHRRDSLKAEKILSDKLMSHENVEFLFEHRVDELIYDKKLTAVRLTDIKSGESKAVECDGLFVSIGRRPATELVENQLSLDKSGYIVADESTRTNIPGVYAVGDVRTKPLRQVVTAVSDGAVAAHMAEQYIAAEF